MDIYKNLCAKLLIQHQYSHLLKIALTHSSYNTKSKNGSRYIFLGQTEFKGKTARILFEYVSGSGTQLQHYLGNLFKNKHLDIIYKYYNLDDYIRYGESFKAQDHRHIFTYALLGCLSDIMTDENLKKFIYQWFIDNSSHLLPNTNPQQKDYKSQCIVLCKQVYSNKPKIIIEKKEAIYVAKVVVNGKTLSQVETKSYVYVQKKAWKQALRTIAEEQQQLLLQDKAFILREEKRNNDLKQKIKTEKEAKLKAYFKRREIRSQVIRARKAQRESEAIERHKKRQLAKQRLKERRELIEKQQRLKEMGLQNISASKRRILEDRGILPKK